MSATLLKRLFTVEEYHKMMESGILKEGDRVELIRGEIVQISPIGPIHAACIDRINELFMMRMAGKIIVRVQNPVQLDDRSEPKPDLTLLRRRPDFYRAGHPQPEDIFLVVEVADSTVRSDRQIKIPLYAEDGISEVWLININDYCVEVYRDPTTEGYQSMQKFEEGLSLNIQAFPDILFTVAELLG